MKMMVLFSVIFFTLTLPDGHDTYSIVEKCILKISSKYPTESQICSTVLELGLGNKRKANVCSELYDLYDEICSYNVSFGALDLPESQNVSETNCVVPCAGLPIQYLPRLSGDEDSCQTMCLKDHEAVAVLVKLVQLKGFIADLKQKGIQKVSTATNSTPVQSKPPTLTSKVGTAVSEEPDVESTTTAAGNNNSAPEEEDEKKPTTAAGNSNSSPKEDVKKPTTEIKPTEIVGAKVENSSEKLQQLTSPSNAAGNNNSAPEEEDEKKLTTAARRMSPSPIKSDGNSTTTGEMKTSPTQTDVKLTTTAAGENYSKPLEPDVTTTTTAQKGKSLSPTQPYSKRTTTAVERKTAPIGIAVTQATTETDEEYNIDEGLDFDSENTNEEADVSNKIDEINEDKFGDENVDHDEHYPHGPSKTDEKDETSKLDDTPSSYHFLIYFLAFIVLCVAAYIVFHNKHKIIAFIIEGKQGRRGGRPSTKQYTPLKSKVEDVMPFIEKSTTQSNYIY